MTKQEYFNLCDDCCIDATNLIGTFYFWLLDNKKYLLAKELKEVQCRNLSLDIAILNLSGWSNDLNSEILNCVNEIKPILKLISKSRNDVFVWTIKSN